MAEPSDAPRWQRAAPRTRVCRLTPPRAVWRICSAACAIGLRARSTGSEQLSPTQTKAALSLRRRRFSPAPDASAGSASADGARSTTRSTKGSFSAAAAKPRAASRPGHHDLGGAQPQVERIEQRRVGEQVVGRRAAARRRTAGRPRARQASSPASTASRTRFCAATAFGLGVASSVVAARPHHQAFGVVGGEEVAAGVADWRSGGRSARCQASARSR